MDEEYNYTNNGQDDSSGQNDSGYGSYMPPPPQNGYGNNPPPPQNGYGNNPPPPQNGYGNYPPPPQNGYGNYPPPPQNGYGNYPPPPQNSYGYPNNGGYVPPVRNVPQTKSNGLAIAAMVTALANLIMFNSILSIITVPVAVIMAIVALKRKKGSKVLSFIAIGASAISTLIFSAYIYYAVNIWPEIKYFRNNHAQIMEEYDRTGEIPERFEKFDEIKYRPLWRMLGFKNFDAFFENVAEIYDENYRDNNNSSAKKPAEKPTETPEEDTTSEGYEDIPYDYDHSGEDLVVLG